MNKHVILKALLTALFVFGTARVVVSQQLAMTVDVNKASAPISPYMYGFFTELHESNNEGGFWAEMLGDRKFFSPVNSG
jgi:hypothetical protein